ncbi:MAG: 1,2-phenylacetyl-CoA epoxidase subunit PaaC [Candidatus Limnocylindrales bacterium]
MTALEPERRATRQLVAPDLPRFDAGSLDDATRAAVAELLLTMADDEFVLGFWDSEWTGIAPMLEEDVAFSSMAQDEIGHARLLYEMLAQLTRGDADTIAFGRQAEQYRHCRLLDHPRTDWSFSVVRRWLYDTADSVRLTALRASSFRPLAEIVAKIRREEAYHLMHMDLWLRRLAQGGEEPRRRLEASLAELWPDALSVFAPSSGEALLVEAGILAEPLAELAARQFDGLRATMADAAIDLPGPRPEHVGGRDRTEASDAFAWLWGQFTMVYRSEPGATW